MSNYESHQRIFLDGRMQPWHPDNDLFIRSELAKMQVQEPERHASMKKFYEDKMSAYKEAHPEEFAVEEPVTEPAVVEPAVEEEAGSEEGTPDESEPKKPRGRPKKAL